MDKIKRFFGNLSIKKTFMLYMLIFILLATLCCILAINIADNISTNITISYMDDTNNVEVTENGVILQYINGEIEYLPKDACIIKICEFVSAFSIPVFFCVGIFLAALLFYRNKLKTPVEILNGASEKIAGNNLDFHLEYESTDEMGKLCESFEKMRSSLNENNRSMWRAVEERKRLNAAFSHDLRIPLTVLRGYTDMMAKYLPQDKIPKEKMLTTILIMSEHISRLENFVSSMNTLQKLDDITVNPQPKDCRGFFNTLKESAQILCRGVSIELAIKDKITYDIINVDAEIVTRVFENLTSNAVRFAKSKVTVSYEQKDNRFCLSVLDDGSGFTQKDIYNATNPFYKGNTQTNDSHFGLGLNICKILCEKHGGTLVIGNHENGGALIKAYFKSSS